LKERVASSDMKMETLRPQKAETYRIASRKMSATLVVLTGGTWRKTRTMATTMPAAATKRGICQRESFDTDGIIADVACVFASALECGPLRRPAFLQNSSLASRRSSVKR